MIVVVDTDGAVALHEPGDCTRLHVEAPDAATAGAALAAAGAGGPEDDGHVAIAVAWLRAGAEGAAAPGAFDAMVAYAARKGWLSADGAHVRAHVA